MMGLLVPLVWKLTMLRRNGLRIYDFLSRGPSSAGLPKNRDDGRKFLGTNTSEDGTYNSRENYHRILLHLGGELHSCLERINCYYLDARSVELERPTLSPMIRRTNSASKAISWSSSCRTECELEKHIKESRSLRITWMNLANRLEPIRPCTIQLGTTSNCSHWLLACL